MTSPYRERHLSAQDGLQLYYRDYGDKLSKRVPVLCLTGLTRNSADFDDLATRLAGERRVLCPDYRGRGRSAWDRDWRNYDPMVYLGDIRHILTANDVDRVVVIGSSLGGILSMGMAVLFPTSVAAVVINDIGPDVDGDGLGRILDFIGADRPQPDWPSAVRALRHSLPRLASKRRIGGSASPARHIAKATTGSCISTGTSRSRSPCCAAKARSRISGRSSARCAIFPRWSCAARSPTC